MFLFVHYPHFICFTLLLRNAYSQNHVFTKDCVNIAKSPPLIHTHTYCSHIFIKFLLRFAIRLLKIRSVLREITKSIWFMYKKIRIKRKD